MPLLNVHGQPVGDPLPWRGACPPGPVALRGRDVGLRPLTAADADALAHTLGRHDDLWTYQATEAPTTAQAALATIESAPVPPHGSLVAIVDRDDALLGRLQLMRADPGMGTIEVGAIVYSPGLQRTRAATEVQFLMTEHVFETLGYRRYEWKCDSLNAPSRRAAVRLGFTEEGTWRHALVTKGRNRDTTWFSMTDADWPRVRAALETWLDEANHDADGRQRRSLAQVRESLR